MRLTNYLYKISETRTDEHNDLVKAEATIASMVEEVYEADYAMIFEEG